jgi:hypothetical protein
VLQRFIGYVLVVAGGMLVLTALPLWFWLSVLGVACVAVGWYLLGSWQ